MTSITIIKSMLLLTFSDWCLNQLFTEILADSREYQVTALWCAFHSLTQQTKDRSSFRLLLGRKKDFLEKPKWASQVEEMQIRSVAFRLVLLNRVVGNSP